MLDRPGAHGIAWLLVSRWIHSPVFDGVLIVGPAVVSVLLVLLVPALRAEHLPPWGWLVFVVGIDVAHVWSSLYRTYLDPDELRRRRTHYVVTPLICFGAGVVLYSLGSLAFWRVLAYLAVLHFVRQQYGFVMLYRHRAGERGSIDALLDKVAIYSVMLYPLAYWHARDDRVFAWFIAGDFVALPAWTAGAAGVLYATALLAFALRQAQRALRGEPLSWGKLGIVASTAATWYVGIVAFNSDFAFTVTNVVAHGLPYLALVWLYGRRKWTAPKSWRTRLYRPALLWAFVGAAILLAYLEEGAWDLLVWHEHASLFGDWQLPALPKELLAVVVPLLILPQATHYVLDAWIWKFDGSNPGLRGYLFGDSEPPTGGSNRSRCEAAPADRTRGVLPVR